MEDDAEPFAHCWHWLVVEALAFRYEPVPQSMQVVCPAVGWY